MSDHLARFDRYAISGLWLTWALGVGGWLALSIYEQVAHDDSGSFIGGGIAMVLWTAIVVALHAVTRWTR